MFLDYAASAPVEKQALEQFVFVSRINGNSSGFSLLSQKLKEIERRSAFSVGRKINADGESVLFTNSATMSNNVAILGVAQKYPGCHFITSKIEHKSVLSVFKHLERKGYEVTYLDVDRFGYVNLQQLRSSIKKNTKLISIQMFNSEIGTLQDIQKIGEIAFENKVLFHSDASQAFCKYPIDVEKFHLDFLTISGYKIGAPKGIAALYVRDRSKLEPILFGSGDPLFPGTKPTALICAFAKAVEVYKIDRKKLEYNFNMLAREVRKISGVHINSCSPSHVFSVSIDGVLLSDILEKIGDYAFSAGCSCLGQEQSNVMQAIYPEGEIPPCTLRISFSDAVPTKVLIQFARKLKKVVEQLRKEKSVGTGCEKKKSDGLMKVFDKYK